jgi:hypothetical protein
MKLKLPKLPHLPRLNIEPLKKIGSYLIKYKILITVFIFLIALVATSVWLRGYLAAKIKPPSENSGNDIFYASSSANPKPTLNIPSPPEDNAPDTSGNSDLNDTEENYVMLTPFPTFAPLPTLPPVPTITATTTQTSSGNSNCTTGGGVPNSWYSDVYPNPPMSTGNGSITLVVTIRDCNENTAPVSDALNISLSSGDSNTQVNGHTLPYVVTAQNGQASFIVTSQVTGTVVLTVRDTTGSFNVTDINNNNPRIAFANNSSGNSSCASAAGVSNSWYSDVYPASPVSVNVGSTATFTVDIRDCNRNTISSDSLTFSQTSSDSTLTVNGSAAPVTVQAQNGQATFNVTSQTAGTDTFTIQDTTGSFTVTDTNNNNPSITFTAQSSPTPTPTSSPANTPTPGPTITPIPTPSVTITPTPASSPAPTPGS